MGRRALAKPTGYALKVVDEINDRMAPMTPNDLHVALGGRISRTRLYELLGARRVMTLDDVEAIALVLNDSPAGILRAAEKRPDGGAVEDAGDGEEITPPRGAERPSLERGTPPAPRRRR